MPRYGLGDAEPEIHPDAYVHPDAVLIGNVTIGAESTVWPCAVLRGDDSGIRVGARSSVQDGAVIHCLLDTPTVIGDDCTIGHNVHIEGCEIHDWALVGSGSIVLPHAVIGRGSIVGANAMVAGGTVVPPLSMALGVPAKIREGTVAEDANRENAEAYVERGRFYRANLRRLD
ncbi:MAG: gamma carbonic anhydrase family protein [Acidimicrobiia bacterium]|nr:gamma carbonic anhydrase family protein [Acidimicrobiia bacterium]